MHFGHPSPGTKRLVGLHATKTVHNQTTDQANTAIRNKRILLCVLHTLNFLVAIYVNKGQLFDRDSGRGCCHDAQTMTETVAVISIATTASTLASVEAKASACDNGNWEQQR